jgi:hypothetical protein
MLATVQGLSFPSVGAEPPLTPESITASVDGGWRPTTCPLCGGQPAAFFGEAIGLLAYFICSTCQRFALTPLALEQIDKMDEAARHRLSAHAATAGAPPCFDETTVRAVVHGA